ncbi:MAG: nicotinate-nucleotide adenylyltransferase [Tissierellaceae bacterium]|jgi:nicotinate-nucleotide adenylyltransferase|nr:nicotinate-nucleotide adenylyltransferase [Tissierellaceae bacterium]
MKSNKIGIMGGTFDPVHIGHLIIAEESRVNFDLDKIIFVPTGEPPHKNLKNVTSAKDRYEMTLLSIMHNPYFYISDIEIKREGLTYTIDTIKYFKKRYPKSEIFFIIGADSLINIDKWKNSEELLRESKFIVAKRVGIEYSLLEERINEINDKYSKIVFSVTTPYIDISSTDIRKRVKNGENIKYYLPLDVEAYIKKNRLYR